MAHFEYLFVRADRLALGDILNDVHEAVGRSVVSSQNTSTVRPVTVQSLELLGDDVEINGGSISTSQGNVFWVRRKVVPTDLRRWKP